VWRRSTARPRDWAEVATARFSRPRGGGEHPRSVDRIRPLLAGRGLAQLIAALAALLLAAGLLAGAAFELTESRGDDRSLLEWWTAGFTGLATGNTPGSSGADSGSRDVVNAAVAFGGVVIPALFLGAILFRVLVVPEVFVFRNRIALVGEPSARCLAIRLYAATRLRLIEVRCSVELHVETTAPDGSIEARYHELEVRNESWPLAHRHIPFTVEVPLLDGDVDEREGDPRLAAIRGHRVKPGDFLMVTMTARVPELGGETSEAHVFRIPEEVSTRPYTGVRTRPWSVSDAEGWADFDEVA
jgi:hypothetical protein